MTAFEIDVPKLLARVFDSPKATDPILRNLLLQSGMPLADMFVCNKQKGTAVAKNKEELKKSVLSQFSRRQISKRHGGMEADNKTFENYMYNHKEIKYWGTIDNAHFILYKHRPLETPQLKEYLYEYVDVYTVDRVERCKVHGVSGFKLTTNDGKEKVFRTSMDEHTDECIQGIQNLINRYQQLSEPDRQIEREKWKKYSDLKNEDEANAIARLHMVAFTVFAMVLLIGKRTKGKTTPEQAARLPGVKPTPTPPTAPPKPKPQQSTKKRRATTTQAEALYQRLVAAIGPQYRPNVAVVCACLIVTLAAAGTVETVRARTRKPRDPIQQMLRNYEALLTKQGAFKPDVVAERAKGKSSYADTGACLRNVDMRLHRLCNHYGRPDELRYHLLQLTTHRSIFHGRTLLAEHLLRNNGEVRSTCAEMALAIAHHWRVRQLLGIVRERIRGTLRRSSKA